uniref:DUF538 family protein n=1 Tax=Oryza brachyantha TaxID=4533 RepID=J3N450_ORYBR
MASVTTTAVAAEREGAEVVTGAEECFRQSVELMRALGFPEGMMPLRELEECGLVRETGFVWMKQKAPYEHYFRGTGTRVRYDAEVTAFVEEGRMRRMTGVRSKQLMLWVPIVEMSLDGADRVYFKSNVGIGRPFPASALALRRRDRRRRRLPQRSRRRRQSVRRERCRRRCSHRRRRGQRVTDATDHGSDPAVVS